MSRTANDQPALDAPVPLLNGSVGVSGGEKALQKELAKLTCEIKETQERVARENIELQYFKGQSRTGLCKTSLLVLWWMLRIVGFLGFLLLLAGGIVSGDATFLTRNGFNGSYPGPS